VIYVATSWRNPLYEGVLSVLRVAGLPFYDFKHPAPGVSGFAWSEVDPHWVVWTPAEYRASLAHPRVNEAFGLDMNALKACDTLLLVLPCGRSAHLGLGYAIGTGKTTIIYYPGDIRIEPELMYKAADHLCLTMDEVLAALGVPNAG